MILTEQAKYKAKAAKYMVNTCLDSSRHVSTVVAPQRIGYGRSTAKRGGGLNQIRGK